MENAKKWSKVSATVGSSDNFWRSIIDSLSNRSAKKKLFMDYLGTYRKREMRDYLTALNPEKKKIFF